MKNDNVAFKVLLTAEIETRNGTIELRNYEFFSVKYTKPGPEKNYLELIPQLRWAMKQGKFNMLTIDLIKIVNHCDVETVDSFRIIHKGYDGIEFETSQINNGRYDFGSDYSQTNLNPFEFIHKYGPRFCDQAMILYIEAMRE
jgi:hypothetical protein